MKPNISGAFFFRMAIATALFTAPIAAGAANMPMNSEESFVQYGDLQLAELLDDRDAEKECACLMGPVGGYVGAGAGAAAGVAIGGGGPIGGFAAGALGAAGYDAGSALGHAIGEGHVGDAYREADDAFRGATGKPLLGPGMKN